VGINTFVPGSIMTSLSGIWYLFVQFLKSIVAGGYILRVSEKMENFPYLEDLGDGDIALGPH